MKYSKTLVRLIDEAILPAVLLVVAKIFGTVLVCRYFNLSWDFSSSGIVFFSSQDYLLANSYSSLIMFGFVVLGLVWVLIRSHVFVENHIPPTLAARLAKRGWSTLVKTSFVAYSKAFVWLSYAWLVTLILGLQALYGLSYWGVAGVAFLVSVVATGLLAVDIERDVVSPVEDRKDDGPETILDFTELRFE